MFRYLTSTISSYLYFNQFHNELVYYAEQSVLNAKQAFLNEKHNMNGLLSCDDRWRHHQLIVKLYFLRFLTLKCTFPPFFFFTPMCYLVSFINTVLIEHKCLHSKRKTVK